MSDIERVEKIIKRLIENDDQETIDEIVMLRGCLSSLTRGPGDSDNLQKECYDSALDYGNQIIKQEQTFSWLTEKNKIQVQEQYKEYCKYFDAEKEHDRVLSLIPLEVKNQIYIDSCFPESTFEDLPTIDEFGIEQYIFENDSWFAITHDGKTFQSTDRKLWYLIE